MILKNEEDAQTYTRFINVALASSNLLRKTVSPALKKQLLDIDDDWISYSDYDEESKYKRELRVPYRIPSSQELKTAKVVRDMCYKVESLAKLIARLKQGDVTWGTPETVRTEGLNELILRTNI